MIVRVELNDGRNNPQLLNWNIKEMRNVSRLVISVWMVWMVIMIRKYVYAGLEIGANDKDAEGSLIVVVVVVDSEQRKRF